MLESRSVSYGTATSWLPVVDLLKEYFQVHDRDDARSVREKVSVKLVTLDQRLLPELGLTMPEAISARARHRAPAPREIARTGRG